MILNKNNIDIYGIDRSDLKRLIDVIYANKKITMAILFGSRAKKSFKKYSDIDIAIKANDLSINELLEIKVMIEDLMLPYDIDIVDYNRISNQALKDHINRVGLRIL
jgi:uncharacterized protein